MKVKITAAPLARQFGSKLSFLMDRRPATPSGGRPSIPGDVIRQVSERDISAPRIEDLRAVRVILSLCLLVTRPLPVSALASALYIRGLDRRG